MPEVICPSGLSGEIRKLKVREENILANTRAMRGGAGLNKVLANIWLKTNDIGPYDGQPHIAGEDHRIEWSRVLQGDHFYAVMQMRIATYGPMFAFRQQCTSEVCRERFEWEVDLTKLEVKKLSDESREIFVRDNKFETIVRGTKITFKLLLADVQKKFARIRVEQRDRMATAALRMQIIDVEGVSKKDLNDWFEDLDSDEASDLRDEFDAAGCGIETEIEVECSHCETIFEINLPFGSRDFFSKSRRDKTKPKEAKTPAS